MTASTAPVPRIGVVIRPEVPPERLATVVASGEAAGLDDLWLWEDCFRQGGLTSATAALAWTSSVRVGLGLMPVPLRNPAVSAMEIAAVARMFPGRFAPGFGHGVLEWMGQVGARVESPLTLLRESSLVVRRLLRGEKVTMAGRYITMDEVQLTWPPEQVPPLMIGARKPKTMAVAGEVGDGTILDTGSTPDHVRTALTHIAPSDGHDVVVYVYAGADEQARSRIRAEPQQMPAEAMAIGGPGEIADSLDRFAEAGATTVVLLQPSDDPDIEGFIALVSAARAELRRAR